MFKGGGGDILEKGKRLHVLGSGGVLCLRRLITVRIGISKSFDTWHREKYTCEV